MYVLAESTWVGRQWLHPVLLGRVLMSACLLLTVVFVCMMYCTAGGVLDSSTTKCTAPSVLSGCVSIQDSASVREAKPSTCTKPT